MSSFRAGLEHRIFWLGGNGSQSDMFHDLMEAFPVAQCVPDILGRQQAQAERRRRTGRRAACGAHGRAQQRHGPRGAALPVGIPAAPRHPGWCVAAGFLP